MPVTAKFSRAFYDRFGDDLVTELVEWFNTVDAIYRTDLREVNEANFVRFDTKLAQRVAELDARIDRRATELEARIDRVSSELEVRIDRVSSELEARIDRVSSGLEARIDRVSSELGGRIDRLEERVERVATEFNATLEARLSSQTRWLASAMLGWATLVVVVVGVWRGI